MQWFMQKIHLRSKIEEINLKNPKINLKIGKYVLN